jgi:hypothetical protein
MSSTENENIIVNADGTDREYEENEGIENEPPSFAFTEDEANEREANIDVTSLGLDEQFDRDLSELKLNLYNETVNAPPVGSDEAQDMGNLERYEKLLLQFHKLAMGALTTSTPSTSISPNILAQYPEPTQPLVVAYYQRICDFQRTNRDRQIKDVLKDLLQRRLQEQTSPYSRVDDGEQSIEYS